MSRPPQAVAAPGAARNVVKILATGGIEQLFRLQQAAPVAAQFAAEAGGGAPGGET